MNIQELATAHVEKIAAKAIILNNQHLGMVVQWEDNFYQGNRGHTYLGNPDERAQIYPDFVRVCNSFNVKCERVMYRKDLRAAIQRMLDAKEPYVLDVVTALQRTRAAIHSGRPHRGRHDLEAVTTSGSFQPSDGRRTGAAKEKFNRPGGIFSPGLSGNNHCNSLMPPRLNHPRVVNLDDLTWKQMR